MNVQPAPGETRGPIPPYAVIFRTHIWDNFVERQFQRLLKQTTSGDVYVVVDETRGRVDGISHDKVFRVTDQQFLDEGFVAAGEGSMQWYSGDYPLYAFRQSHKEYSYYLQLEYDANIHVDIDDLIRRVGLDGVDFVGLTKGEPVAEWHWLKTCLNAYSIKDIRHQLICISIYSGRTLDVLRHRRLEMAQAYRMGSLTVWPMCEGYIATEVALNGLRSEELSRYGDTSAYDWWPPYIERALPQLTTEPFVHPILDEKRFVSSMLKHPLRLREFIDPVSQLHRKLRSLPMASYPGVIFGPEMSRSFRSAMKRRFTAQDAIKRRVPDAVARSSQR